jgi:hypothetical protein
LFLFITGNVTTQLTDCNDFYRLNELLHVSRQLTACNAFHWLNELLLSEFATILLTFSTNLHKHHFAGSLHRRNLKGNETIQDAFDTVLPTGMDVSPEQPVSQIMTVINQHELPSCTSLQDPAGNGLPPGSAKYRKKDNEILNIRCVTHNCIRFHADIILN